jgi:hypothetical protein
MDQAGNDGPERGSEEAPHTDAADSPIAAEAAAATRNWLEKAVIGLGLCPFAAQPARDGRIRYRVSGQRSNAGLLEDLCQELEALQAADPQQCETTLLIHPHVLADFGAYNDFLDEADALVRGLGLEGELQIASFHPAYQFAGTSAGDIENCTNRSPYPMLHLLREASIARAVAAFPDADQTGTRNIQTLRNLGREGWQRLWT